MVASAAGIRKKSKGIRKKSKLAFIPLDFDKPVPPLALPEKIWIRYKIHLEQEILNNSAARAQFPLKTKN